MNKKMIILLENVQNCCLYEKVLSHVSHIHNPAKSNQSFSSIRSFDRSIEKKVE